MSRFTKIRRTRTAGVAQGDLYRDIEMIESVEVKGNQLLVTRIRFPVVIVLTQDCDLEQDYGVRWSTKSRPNQDKMLFSVLVSPLYNKEHFILGEHLENLGRDMERISTKKKLPHIVSNQIPRFHHLSFSDSVPIVDSVIDFKHYFSVNVADLKGKKKTHFIGKVAELYREDISSRFASYLSRIGLP